MKKRGLCGLCGVWLMWLALSCSAPTDREAVASDGGAPPTREAVASEGGPPPTREASTGDGGPPPTRPTPEQRPTPPPDSRGVLQKGCEKHDDALLKLLPKSQTKYCIKAHPDCQKAGAGCPLYITLNAGGTYFSKVDEPEVHGKLMVVASYQKMDGNSVKDPLAELPRVLGQEYPGLDKERIYLIGWSAGAGGVSRGMCHSSKGFDQSKHGTTSDIYAAIATLGGCPSCSGNFKPTSGNWHVFATNGINDKFGGKGCEDKLRQLARMNGCSKPDASWCKVSASDPWVPGARGDDKAQKLSFGSCPRGDVVGYRFADEGHVVSYKKHFQPKVKAYEMVWQFLQGRTKRGQGNTGAGAPCAQ